MRGGGFGNQSGGENSEEPDRHIDQKEVAPAQAEQIDMYQPPAQHLTGNRRQPQRHPQQTKRFAPVVARKVNPNGGIHLREQQGGGQALQDPGADEIPGSWRQATTGRRQRKTRHTDNKESPATIPISQPPAGDQ